MVWNSPHSKFVVPFAWYIEKYELLQVVITASSLQPALFVLGTASSCKAATYMLFN